MLPTISPVVSSCMTFVGPMPETARILAFPDRSNASALPVSPEEAKRVARAYLETPLAERHELNGRLLSPDILMSICALLRERIEANPESVAADSLALHGWAVATGTELGIFDESDYFVGELALITASAFRLLGKRLDVERWLDRAEASFRHTLNPAPLLAGVAYQRLAFRCEIGKFEEVAELAPSLAMSFSRLGMVREHAKCRYLEGVALKQSGSHEMARERFELLVTKSVAEIEPGVAGSALSNLADVYASEGQYELAVSHYERALPLLRKANRPASIAHLKSVIAETFRRQGRPHLAIEAYRGAIQDYLELGMSTWVAYLRVVLAQTLLEADRSREAEWEILAALPTIEEQQMAPEGFAAVALLRESVRQRKTDSKALLQLREYLQARN